MDEALAKKRVREIIDLAADGNVSEFVRMCHNVDRENAPSQSMVLGYRKGKSIPGLIMAAVMAKAAGVTLDWLAGLSDKGGPQMESEEEGIEAGEAEGADTDEPPRRPATIEELEEFKKWLADPNRGIPDRSVHPDRPDDKSLTVPGFVFKTTEENPQELVYIDLTLRGREAPITVSIPGFVVSRPETTTK